MFSICTIYLMLMWTKRAYGVLCGREMNVKIKGKVYCSGKTSTCVRSRDNDIEGGTYNKLEVAEMRMLGWMCEVTKLDRMRNERIKRETFIEEKSQRKFRK